jgi:hypothetical protein
MADSILLPQDEAPRMSSSTGTTSSDQPTKSGI